MKRLVHLLAACVLLGTGLLTPFGGTAPAHAASLESQISEIYVATFGRAPDYDGLMYWVGEVQAGRLSVGDVASNFFFQPETQQMYPEGTSDASFITSIYNNMFNRQPDAEGLAYWVGELEAQRMRRDQAIMYLIGGAKAETGSPVDAALLTNKTEVALYFAQSAAGRNANLSVLRSQATEVISMVTDDLQTVATAKARVDYFVSLLQQGAPGPEEGVTATLGSEVAVSTAPVDSSGATVTLDQGDAAGVTIRFQEGTLDQAATVRIRQLSASLTPRSGTFSGIVLDVDTGDQDNFQIPMEITIPFDPAREFPVPYYVHEDGTLEPCQITRVDMNAGTLSFHSFHTSPFTWILEAVDNAIDAIIAAIGSTQLTAFQPGTDGFYITNTGTPPVSTGGNCFGMSMWARWYYKNKGSGFYSKYRDPVSGCSNQVIGQEIIAPRAHLSVARVWNSYVPELNDWQSASAQWRMLYLASVLANTAVPVPIYLANAQYAHAVLAYSATATSLSIYDPNYPGSERTITYDPANNRFLPYGSYTTIAPLGTGTFYYRESFDDIYADAEAGFASPDATITITSHTAGEHVSDRNIVLEGYVTWGIAPVEKLEVTIGTNTFSTSVDEFTGYFSLPVTLDPGENLLQFVTKARRATSNSLVAVSNDRQCNDFTLYADSEAAVILVTLTWDKNDTDVDLYVIDPTGDYSAYYHMTTLDGGVLDYDDVNGYGPEHWTLTYSDTVRWDQDYRIRLHYYSDHGNGGTSYQVSIKMYEGTDRETVSYYSGYLSASNPDNDGPTDTGPDWVDIAVVRPTQTQALTAPLAAAAPVSLTTPVPSAEERRAAKEAALPR